MEWYEGVFDWDGLRAQGSASGIPRAIGLLAGAETESHAKQAYWQIDNIVVVQGALFEGAPASAALLAAALCRSRDVGRPYILELLVQLGSGVPSPSELALGNTNLTDECLAEISRGAAFYFHFLEHGTDEERCHCVDLLGLCCRYAPVLRDRVDRMYSRLLTEDIPDGLRSLVENWRHEISVSGE